MLLTMNPIDPFFAQVPVLSTLTQRLQEEKYRTVALYAHNAVLFTAALAAAWRAGAEVFLLPNLSASSLEWGKQNHCVFLSDSDIIAGVWRIDKMPVADACDETIAANAQLWLKTSGSSGEPKIVGKTAGQMVSEALALKAVLPEKWQGLKAVSSVSPQHLYGLTFRIFTGLAMGWILDEYQQMYPEDLAAASNSPCVWIASPALLKRLDAQIDRIVGLNTVQGMISAGGMMSAAVADNIHKHFHFYPFDIYGSTETGVMAHRQGTGDWTLFDSVKAWVQDDCLHILSAWSGGECAMADMAEIKGKSLKLLGRNDRILKLEDKRISLDAIEQHLMTHRLIKDAFCGISQKNQRIAAWIALNDDGIAILKQQGRKSVLNALKQHCGEHFDAAVCPKYWRLTQELPRNAQSKISVADFQAAFNGRQTTPQWQLSSENKEIGEYIVTGTVPLDLAYFDGHFQQFPLVPGAIEIQWAMNLAKKFYGKNWQIDRIENLKFQQFIRPNDLVTIRLLRDKEKNRIQFNISVGEKNCAGGRIKIKQ